MQACGDLLTCPSVIAGLLPETTTLSPIQMPYLSPITHSACLDSTSTGLILGPVVLETKRVLLLLLLYTPLNHFITP